MTGGMIVIIAAIVAVFGALVGVKIRRTTYFQYPWDFLSVTVYVLLFMGVFIFPDLGTAYGFWTPPLEYYGAFGVGYVFGYCVDGARHYFLVEYWSFEDKHTQSEPWITYYVDGRLCLAIQTNRRLWGRLVRGEHVQIVSNCAFDPDWTDTRKYPLFPIFPDVPKIALNSFEMKVTPSGSTVMRVTVAYGSMASIPELIYKRDTMEELNRTVEEQAYKIVRMYHFVKSVVPKLMANYIGETYSKSPGFAFMEALDHSEGLREEVFVKDKESEDSEENEETEEPENEEER